MTDPERPLINLIRQVVVAWVVAVWAVAIAAFFLVSLPFADRPYRPVPDPWQRFRDPCRRDASRSRHAGAAGKGPLHRLLQLAGMEDRQSPWHLRVPEPGPIRHASGLLLDRWP